MMRRTWVLAVAAAAALMCLPAVASAQRLVFVVRHAERADAGMAKTMMQADPDLSAAGYARANKLASLLGEAGIKGIYVTEFKRTHETGQPLATRLGISETQASSKDTAALVRRMRDEHANDIVLVVAHGDTISGIIQALGGPAVTVGDNDYGNLFVVVPGTGTLTRIRF